MLPVVHPVPIEVGGYQKNVDGPAGPKPERQIRMGSQVVEPAQTTERVGSEKRVCRALIEHPEAEELALIAEIRRRDHRTGSSRPRAVSGQGKRRRMAGGKIA